ncbi:MAG TPA: hypothetical protein DCR10_11820, partial [Acidimicrobiaceae bacterium]|nr:hypothetical protein [Acidimicrobiaceae bacterium]
MFARPSRFLAGVALVGCRTWPPVVVCRQWGIGLLVAAVIVPGAALSQDRKPKAAANPAAQKQTADNKKAAAKAAVKKAATQAVERALRNIFGGQPMPLGVPQARPPKKTEPVGNGDPTARDRIDLLAPQDPRQAKLLRQAREWHEAGQHARVLEAVSVLLNPPSEAKFEADSLFRSEGGRWVTVRDEANRLLGELPDSFRATFRSRFGAEARRRLAAGGESAVVEVADRFFHTEAGRQAANRLASRHMDRGRLGLSSFWLSRLLDAADPVTRSAAWKLKAAWVFHRVGQPKRVTSLLEGLADAGQLNVPAVGTVARDQWLGVARPAILPEPELVDWPIFYGTSSRRGRSEGGTPLLLSRWHRRMTHRHAVASVVRELVEDLDDMRQAMIPAFVPLVVGRRAVFRTLRGVEVIDIESGRVLWETQPEVAVESLMGSKSSQSMSRTSRLGGFQMARVAGIRAAPNVIRFGPVNGSAMQHPLTGLLFQHTLHGIPSSDGKQLFLVQDRNLLRGPISPSRFGGFNPFGGGSVKSQAVWNTLVSYDLASGRPGWEVGGVRMDEPFDLPLAGTKFLGAPTPHDGKLYVVGESSKEVRLHVLEAESGRPLWSQRIAYVDLPALSNPNRRWASSHVAISDGVAVCPTTVGWLVGVECSSRRILWAHRYAKPQPENQTRRGMGMPAGFISAVPGEAMRTAWAAAPPVICGDRLVFTPHAEPVLKCLDLYTGRELWQKPKGGLLYVAGGFGDRLVMVGADQVTAWRLADGKQQWSTKLNPRDGRPCGRGVATDGKYHVPLSSGQIATLSLEDGRIADRTFLPESADGGRVLGNLVMSHGLMLVLGPDGLTGYEQKEALLARIDESLKENPKDSWALLKQAELSLLGRQHNDALDRLNEVDRPSLEASLHDRFDAARRTALVGAIRRRLSDDDPQVDAWMEALGQLADSRERKLGVTRLSVERAVARQQWEQAVSGFQDLAKRFPRERIELADDEPVRVRIGRWAGGQLKDIWPRLPAQLKATMDKQLRQEAMSLQGGKRTDQRAFVDLWGFHPAA